MPWTEETFTNRYGYSPQEYFWRVVKSAAEGPNIVELEAKMAAAKAAVEATKGWESAPTQEEKQLGANAETEVANLTMLLNAAAQNQKYAKQFLAGELADFSSYAGNECYNLKKAGLIDTTLVPPVVAEP